MVKARTLSEHNFWHFFFALSLSLAKCLMVKRWLKHLFISLASHAHPSGYSFAPIILCSKVENLIIDMLMLICITPSHCALFSYDSMPHCGRSVTEHAHSTVHRRMVDDEDSENRIMLFFIEETRTVKNMQNKLISWFVASCFTKSRYISRNNPMILLSLLQDCSMWQYLFQHRSLGSRRASELW